MSKFTRREILPGVHGRVVISPHAETSVTHVGVTFEPIIGHGYAALSAPELRAAADVLTQLADALEPNDPSQEFGAALTALPALAHEAGCYVAIKVYASKAECDKAEGRS